MCGSSSSSVAFLVERGREVIYDGEHFFDGYKADADYALATLKAAARGGARIVVLCDTNGGTLPSELKRIAAHTRDAVELPLGIHTHNDSGMAAANAVAAVEEGAIQVQGTFNGYGERCGNANLCTVIPTLELKLDKRCIGRDKVAELMEFSRFLSEVANVYHDHRQPYVGDAGSWPRRQGRQQHRIVRAELDQVRQRHTMFSNPIDHLQACFEISVSVEGK